MTSMVDSPEDSGQGIKCSHCGNYHTYNDKTKWGLRPHRRYDSSGSPICGKCYARALWKKKIPVGVSCERCGSHKTTLSKYGEPRWVKNGGGYLCWSCYTIRNNTGKIFSPERRKNISIGIRRALEAGVTMGQKIHTINETVFDTLTQESAYWIGNLMADGYIHVGKVGNPRIALTLAMEDRDQLVKFRRFLNCSNEIQTKICRTNGKEFIQYTVRFSSKRIANALISFGVTARKSLTARVIGLENNRHFWRGVIDGDGYFKNKDGIDGDRIVVVGSYNLMSQFAWFIKHKIPGSEVKIKQDKNIHRLFVYGYTARKLSELLYANCSVALDRKLAKAQKMFSYIQ
jgi:hypothetical protein